MSTSRLPANLASHPGYFVCVLLLGTLVSGVAAPVRAQAGKPSAKTQKLPATASPLPAGCVARMAIHADVMVTKGLVPDPAAAADTTTIVGADAAPVYVPATAGQGVRSGQGVRTLRRAFAELAFVDHSMLRINERTDLIVQDAAALRNVHLQNGSVWIRVAKGVKTQIETPCATAVARGTAFEVTQEEDGAGAMRLAVQEGNVDLEVGGSVVRTVHAGEIVRIARNGVPGDPQKMTKQDLPKSAGGDSDPWWSDAANGFAEDISSFMTQAAQAAGITTQELATAAQAAKTAAGALTRGAQPGGGGGNGGGGGLLSKLVGGVVKTATTTGVKTIASTAVGDAAAKIAVAKGAAGIAGKAAAAASGGNSGNKGEAEQALKKAEATAVTANEKKTEPKKEDEPAISPDGYTGIVIDARHLNIQRTPAPQIFGPLPDGEVLYPDPKHVPTPDEVQDESVVRYYFNEDGAKKGFVGANPLILKAIDVVGPGRDSVRLSTEDMARLKALDRQIHFTLTWRVGILLPEGR